MPHSFLGAEQDFHFGVQYNQAGVSGVYGYNDFIYTYLSGGASMATAKCVSRSAMARGSATSARSSTTVSGWAPADAEPGRARRSQQRLCAAAGRAGRQRAADRQDVSEGGFLHLGQRVAAARAVNFKLTGDGKTIIKSHWGRYHPQITTGEFANIIGPNIKPVLIGTYNPATGEIEDLVLTSSSENLSMAPGYNSPRTDQFIVGFERELTTKMGLQVNYVRKWGRDFAALARHGRHLRPGAGRRRLGQESDRYALSTSSG